ncbi:hypothetical protein [Pseudomonas laurylsulfatiphila]|uniref:hypothetical protein n=1 Tax=Pseudomonas laurylsulfatiphila TaxID=2011015 RepID=UPI003D1BEF25
MSYSFNRLCKKDGSVKSENTKADIEAVIAKVPWKFAFNSSSAEQKTSEFCKAGEKLITSWEKESLYSSTVVTQALVNYNECRALELQGLRITHHVAEPWSVSIYGNLSRSIVASIDTISTNNLSCTSTSFSKNKLKEVIDGSKKIDLKGNFVIKCERTSINKKGEGHYPRAGVTLGTSVGLYTIIVPDDTLEGFDLASESKNKYMALQKDSDAKLIAITNESEVKIKELQLRLDNTSAEGFVFYESEAQADINNNYYNAASVFTFAQGYRAVPYSEELCGPERTPNRKLLGTFTGATHGTNFFVLTCLRK